MLTVFIWLATAILVLDCLFLILLVLVQLPKKEAGAGLAFGGGATDALFGAGTGTALTKITKYSTIVFFVLSIGLALAMTHENRRGGRISVVEEKLKAQSNKSAPTQLLTPPPVTSAAPQSSPAEGLGNTQAAPKAAAPATNAPSPK
jgi:protein translocase SecG subunit